MRLGRFAAFSALRLLKHLASLIIPPARVMQIFQGCCCNLVTISSSCVRQRRALLRHALPVATGRLVALESQSASDASSMWVMQPF